MSEITVIKKTPVPVSKEALINDLTALGIERGDQIMVHASMKKIGWIIGAERTLVEALIAAIGPTGTLVMPAHTGNMGDPSRWVNPPVPKDWVDPIKAAMPAYDPRKTPTYGIGRVAEYFRTFPGVHRSEHPQHSLTAWGKAKKHLLSSHPLGHAFDEESPFKKIVEANFKIVMIGTRYDTVSCLHYAETKNPATPRKGEWAYVMEHAQRKVKPFEDFDYETAAFKTIGKRHEALHPVKKGFVGNALSTLVYSQPLIETAVRFFTEASRK